MEGRGVIAESWKLTAPPKPADAAESVRPRDSLSRIADSLEKLASDPEVEIEFGPPLCPSCGKINPMIELDPQTTELSGPMLEIVLPARCLTCKARLFIGIESFSVHQTIETLTEEIEARRAGFQ